MSPLSGAGYEPLEGVDRGFESASVSTAGGSVTDGPLQGVTGRDRHGVSRGVTRRSTVDGRGAIRWRRRESNKAGELPRTLSNYRCLRMGVE